MTKIPVILLRHCERSAAIHGCALRAMDRHGLRPRDDEGILVISTSLSGWPGLSHQSSRAVRGPRQSVKKGKTPVLGADEARALLDAIDTATLIGLRDRALIGLMVYTFARVGAAAGMRVEDVYVQGRRTWVRLHEKGGKRHEMPCRPQP